MEIAPQILSKFVLDQLGCLHPQLPQDVTGLVQRLRRPQVVGLASDDRQYRGHLCAGRIRRSSPAQVSQDMINTDRPNSRIDPLGIARQLS